MRRTYLLALPLLVLACSSDPQPATSDAGPDGSKPKDGGADTGSPVDISGTTSLDVTVVSNAWGTPQDDNDVGTPQSGVAVRVENGQGGYLEGTTDSSGKASIKVDLAKGPFDVTVAKAGVGAASVLDVKAAADLTKKIWLPKPLAKQSFSIAGAINGKKDPANLVMIDAPWFETAFVKANTATYSARHLYVTDDPTDVTLAAIEVDANKNAVNAVLMPGVKRTQGAMTADVTFPSTPATVTTSNLKINVPSTGAVTGADITTVGATGFPNYSNAIVLKTAGKSAVYVGLGLVTKPVANVANLKLQTFGGGLTPDVAYADMNSGTVFLRAYFRTFTDGAQQTIPPVQKLEATGTSLADATVTFDQTGYDYAIGSLYDGTAQESPWVLYFTGTSITAHKVPRLPSSVDITSITQASDLVLSVTVVKSSKKPKDFSDVSGYAADATASSGGQVTAAF
jgi:hypothetical protein